MGDVSRHGIEAPPAWWLPRPMANSVTHVAGLKCYLCPWTEPSTPRSAIHEASACPDVRAARERGIDCRGTNRLRQHLRDGRRRTRRCAAGSGRDAVVDV